MFLVIFSLHHDGRISSCFPQLYIIGSEKCGTMCGSTTATSCILSSFTYLCRFIPQFLILSHFSRRQRRIRRPDKLILLTQTPPPPFFLDSGSPLVRFFFFWILFYFDLLVKKNKNTMNDDLSIVSWRVSCRQHFWLSSIPSLLEYFSSHSITLRINIICLFSPTQKETIGIFVLFYLFLCETQKTEFWVAKTKVFFFFFHGIKKKTTDRETWQFFFFSRYNWLDYIHSCCGDRAHGGTKAFSNHCRKNCHCFVFLIFY